MRQGTDSVVSVGVGVESFLIIKSTFPRLRSAVDRRISFVANLNFASSRDNCEIAIFIHIADSVFPIRYRPSISDASSMATVPFNNGSKLTSAAK